MVSNPSDYGSRWIQWWKESQPRPRGVQAWPLPRDTISDACWHKFPAHGPSGLFLAIMAISWWAHAVKSAEDVTLFKEAAGDLNWVIQELIHMRSSNDPTPRLPSTLQSQPVPCQSQPTHQDPPPSSLPPPPSSCPPRSSSRLSLPSGVRTWERPEGKRVVKPSRKLQENLA